MNDLNKFFIESGEYPSNFIMENNVDYFPKIKQLLSLKTDQINRHRLSPTPLSLGADLRGNPSSLQGLLQCQFDVILVDPPWYEYYARAGGFPPACNCHVDLNPWSFEEIRALDIENISANPSFCFIWCVNKHVEQATACLLKWGFRRIEDVCWIKTNHERVEFPDYLPYNSLNVLKSAKEHLLVGIKGTVQRSRDSHIIHANIDSDIIVAPQPIDFGCTKKPNEIKDLIERFCNGQRRLEIFGSDHTLRPGWVTIGGDLPTNYDPFDYFVSTERNRYVPSTPEIDRLRPKSPRASYSNSPVPSPSLG